VKLSRLEKFAMILFILYTGVLWLLEQEQESK
jgi:hypothetical protein